MARKLSPLAAQITLDLNKWTAGVRQIDRDSEAIKKALKPIGDTLKTVGTAATAVGAALGGTLLALSKKAADFGDALLDASKRTGLTTQSLASLKLLADQSGSSFEGLSKGVGMLSKNLFEAGTKGGQSAKLFKAMGISVKDASGNLRNASDVLPEIADQFAKLEDGSAKTALAMKLFGKAGADLIPLLNEGSAGFQRAREQADKFGISLTRAEAELGDKFNDSLEDSKAAMQGFANAIGVALLPKLTELVNKVNDWIAQMSRWVKAHPELTQAIAKTSAAIFATGGLLLGLTAIVSIVPKVYAGIQLLSTAFKALQFTTAASSIATVGTSLTTTAAGLKVAGAAATKTAGEMALLGRSAPYVVAGAQAATTSLIAVGAASTTAGAQTSILAKVVAGLGPTIGGLAPAIAVVGAALAQLYIAKKIADFIGLTDAVKLSWIEVKKLGENLRAVGGEFLGVVKVEVLMFLKNAWATIADLTKVIPALKEMIDGLADSFGVLGRVAASAAVHFKNNLKAFLEGFTLLPQLRAINAMLESFRPPPIADKLGAPGLPENWIALSGKAADATSDWEKEMQKLLSSMGKTDKSVDKAAEAAKQFEASVQSLMHSITDTTPPSNELVAAIFRLNASGQLSSKAILNLAQHIDVLKNSNDPLIQQLVKQIPLMQLHAKAAEMQAEGLKLVADTTKEWADQLELVIPTATDLLSGLEDLKPLAPGDLVEATAITRVKELLVELDDLKDTVPNVERQVRLLRKEGKSNAEIMALMGGEMEAAARTAKQFNLPLGELTRTIIAQESRVQALRGAWGQTFANLSDHLVDMVTDFDFSFKRIGDIAKDTAKSLLRSFLDGFFKPFKDQLADLGGALADALAGPLFGGGGGKGVASGALGVGGQTGILSKALSKIPGLGFLAGGGAAVAAAGAPLLAGSAAATAALSSQLALPAALSSIAPLAGPGGAAAAGGAAAGGGGLMASIGALATNPITIAAAGAGAVALLIKKFTGQGRETADIFGEGVQKPLLKGDEWFKGLENIIDPITKARESGTLTVEMIQSAQKALEADWKKFAEISQSFIDAEAGVGGKEQLVVDQAFKTLTPIIEDIRTSLQSDLARVSGSPSSLAVIPSVNSVDTVSTAQVPQANVGGGLTITGGINLAFYSNAESPAEWVRWFELNLEDIRTKIIKAVDLADGGDGSGLVTAH